MKFQIKEAREKAGYSQKELAEIIGVAPNTFHGYESGKHDPKSILLEKIAKACHVSVDFLLGIQIEDTKPIKNSPSITDEAMTLAKDYDSLDTHGKRVVRAVTDEEKSRMEQEAAAARWRAGKQQQLTKFLRQKRRETEAAKEPAEVHRFPVPYYLQASSAGYGEWAESGYAEEIDLVKRPPFGTSFIVPVNGDSMEPTYPDGCKVFVRRQTEIRVGEVGIFFMDGKQWIKELGEGELISHNPAYPTRPMTDDIRCQGLVLGICDDSYFA